LSRRSDEFVADLERDRSVDADRRYTICLDSAVVDEPIAAQL